MPLLPLLPVALDPSGRELIALAGERRDGDRSVRQPERVQDRRHRLRRCRLELVVGHVERPLTRSREPFASTPARRTRAGRRDGRWRRSRRPATGASASSSARQLWVWTARHSDTAWATFSRRVTNTSFGPSSSSSSTSLEALRQPARAARRARATRSSTWPHISLPPHTPLLTPPLGSESAPPRLRRLLAGRAGTRRRQQLVQPGDVQVPEILVRLTWQA